MSDILVVLVIALIAVLVWRGPKTLPQIGNMLGRGVKATREEAKAIREDVSPTSPKSDGDDGSTVGRPLAVGHLAHRAQDPHGQTADGELLLEGGGIGERERPRL